MFSTCFSSSWHALLQAQTLIQRTTEPSLPPSKPSLASATPKSLHETYSVVNPAIQASRNVQVGRHCCSTLDTCCENSCTPLGGECCSDGMSCDTGETCCGDRCMPSLASCCGGGGKHVLQLMHMLNSG
ncbi:hypothetical protein BDV06DRAFT_203980 [Aspergillus oleicola]